MGMLNRGLKNVFGSVRRSELGKSEMRNSQNKGLFTSATSDMKIERIISTYATELDMDVYTVDFNRLYAEIMNDGLMRYHVIKVGRRPLVPLRSRAWFLRCRGQKR